jgi:hypothetical protein
MAAEKVNTPKAEAAPAVDAGDKPKITKPDEAANKAAVAKAKAEHAEAQKKLVC